MAEANNEVKDAAQEKKKSPLMLILIGLVVLLVVGGAAGYFLVLKPKGAAEASPTQAAAAPVASQATGGAQLGGAMGPIEELDSFIVNLSDSQGTRYLKLVVQLELSNAPLAEELKVKIPLLRDEVIMLLSSKSYDDVATVAGKRALKRGIMSGVNKYLTTGQVTRVYFTEFVVQ